mmetsp:Transcript_3612/g.8684  ORF Transcript_3612/g.8684 Transcript_3612/m.8684 type:complete len:310 (-) Transcript_3612:99-1028(-)
MKQTGATKVALAADTATFCPCQGKRAARFASAAQSDHDRRVGSCLRTLAAAAANIKEHLLAVGQVHDIRGLGECLSNVLRGIDAAHLDEAAAMLLERLGNHLCGLGLALGADDRRLPLLLRSCHDELLPLGVLLGNLLLLDCPGELFAVGEVGDGDVVHQDVELPCAMDDGLADLLRDMLALRQQLLRIVLRNRGLHHLVGNGWDHALVVVLAEGRVDGGQTCNVGPEEHPDVDGDCLQILRARGGLNELRPQPDVIELRLQEPRDFEVRSLPPYLVFHTRQHIEDHSTLAAIYVKETEGGKDRQAPQA